MMKLVSWTLPVLALFGLLFFGVSCESESQESVDAETPILDEIVKDGLRESLYTGAVLVVGNSREIKVEKAYGFAELYDENLRVVERPDSLTTDYVFDLASLTKIFATTYGMMKLHSEGELSLDDPVAEYIPEFATAPYSEITLRHLLSHTSGLMQWYPTFYEVDDQNNFIEWLVAQPLLNEPGEERSYSDLGFMVLAQVIENVSGRPFDDYLKKEIYDPMGLNNTGFLPNRADIDVVATSHGNPFERKMVHDPDFGYRIDIDPESWNNWRDYTLKGEVNDGNAFYTFRGRAGHAGLFSTGREIASLIQVILNEGKHEDLTLFTEETISEFTDEDSFGNGLGWGMSNEVLNVESVPEGSLGHTGFTGTNFILHPESNQFYIFLTNRQHVGTNSRGSYPDLKEIRSRISDHVFTD